MSGAIGTDPTGPPTGGNQFTLRTDDLDESFYYLDEAEQGFLSNQTGIKEPEDLRRYVFQIQKEAYAIHPYPCIRIFAFVKLKISRYPAYHDLLRLGRDRPNALFLDIGCGVGNDTRKVVADGFPPDQIIATDLLPEFWELGHKVFKSTPQSFAVRFLPGDIFDDSFLDVSGNSFASDSGTEIDDGRAGTEVKTLQSLTPLRGRVSCIHASAFFHLFNEQQQGLLAQKFAYLLSPEPGSFIFGSHVGSSSMCIRIFEGTNEGSQRVSVFCHSPESWTSLWEGIFGVGRVKVEAIIEPRERRDYKPGIGNKYEHMTWSVKRL